MNRFINIRLWFIRSWSLAFVFCAEIWTERVLFPGLFIILFLFISFPFNFGAGGCRRHLLGLQQERKASLRSHPILIPPKSQSVPNFSNYTLSQLTGVISALTLCFPQTAVPSDLHWLFGRLLRNVTTAMGEWGRRIQDPRRKEQRKQNPASNPGGEDEVGECVGCLWDAEMCQYPGQGIYSGASRKPVFTLLIYIKQRDQLLLAQL